MSRAGSLRNQPVHHEGDVEEVEGITVVCKRCYAQPDVVKYNTFLKLLFWECPNGHRDFLEDFDL